MPYTIHPAVPADAEAIASFFSPAFDEHPVIKHMWSAIDPVANQARDLALWQKYISQGPELGQHVFKAVDEKGYAVLSPLPLLLHCHFTLILYHRANTSNSEILAFSRWLFPIPSPTPEKEQERWAMETSSGPGGPLPGMNTLLTEAFTNDLKTGRKELINPRETYFLHILCVREDARRKGLGSLLCEDVLKKADEEGREAFVEMSPMGEGLYYRLGWEKIRETVIQLGELGVEGGEEVRLWSSMRKPRGGAKGVES